MKSTIPILFIVTALSLPSRAGVCESALTNRADVSVTTAGNNYDVYYNSSTSSPFYFPPLNATWVRDALVLSHNFIVSNGFLNPTFSASPNDTCVTTNVSCFADAPLDRIRIKAGMTCMSAASELLTRSVMAHELFHHAQFSYINFSDWPSWGAWSVEATPVTIQDRIQSAMDSNPEGRAYVNFINSILVEPNLTLTARGYEVGLFWSYLCEQFSTETAEPARGTDLIRDFWERTQGNSPDSIKYLRETLAARIPGRTLEEVFLDFQIAAYVRNLDITALPDDLESRYSFADEKPAGGGTPYRNVTRALVPTDASGTTNVVRWGTQFFESSLPNKECQAVGLRAKADGDKILSWAAIAIRGTTGVVEVGRGVGNAFYRAFLNDPAQPYTKLALIAVGINNDATIDYAFGSGQTGGLIREPSSNRVAVVGDFLERRRFQTRIVVTGPPVLTSDIGAGSSVRGLDVSRMSLSLISAATGAIYPADIISATYVSGEYWLVVEAPEITNPADGATYDIQLCVCEASGLCQSSFTNPDAVYYGPAQYNQMLVLDRSYSMHYPDGPGDTSNIEAARNAARVYANAAATNDRLGLVTFTGNNNESSCVPDAAVNASLKLMMDAGVNNRTPLVSAINSVTESGWTSIGDGLKLGRDQFLGVPSSPSDINGIILLSDGIENEGDFWARTNSSCGNPPVRDSFANPTNIGSSIRIDTIAFGSNADQALLQSIADFTRGSYYAIRNNPPSAPLPSSRRLMAAGLAAGEPPPLESLHVANRLAHVHRQAQEELRGQERIFYRGYQMTNSFTYIDIPIYEPAGGELRDPVFAFNWHKTGNTSVELNDPDNAPAEGPGWNIYTSATHKIYQYTGALVSGNYRARFRDLAADPAQLIVMVSGKLGFGVDFNVEVSSPQRLLTGQSCVDSEIGRYMRGLPVDVIASLADYKGPITGLRLEAKISNADGSYNRISMYDDGLRDNGISGDGVYGARYTRTPFFSNRMLSDSTNPPSVGSWGSYSVEVRAVGGSNYEDSFERFDTRYFHVYEFDQQSKPEGCFTDSDGDTMPDRWELLYELDPGSPFDATKDPDKDGLSNEEEFKQGTLPFNPDTDGAGESDGSEVNNGRDPLYDQDDALPPIIDYGIVTRTYHLPIHEPQPNTLILHFPANTNYMLMEIWRQNPGATNWVIRDMVDPRTLPQGAGVYYDTGLTNGLVYSYYLVGLGFSGAMTAPTDVFSGTPKADPVPPEGAILINGGSHFTSQRKVKIVFDVSADAITYKLSEDPLFTGVAYSNLVPAVDFWLAPATNGPRNVSVYGMVRDAAGNESLIMSDSIVLDENDDSDTDGLSDAWETIQFGNLSLNGGADTDGDGFTNAQEFRNNTDPNNRLSPARGSVKSAQPSATNSQLIIDFQGNLYRGTNISGPYELVPGAVTPISVPATNSSEYFIAW